MRPILAALALSLATAATPAAAMTREELCMAHAYNFAVALSLKEQGASRAEAAEMLGGMIDGADARITGALDAILRDAWAWPGRNDDAAERAYFRRCMG